MGADGVCLLSEFYGMLNRDSPKGFSTTIYKAVKLQSTN